MARGGGGRPVHRAGGVRQAAGVGVLPLVGGLVLRQGGLRGVVAAGMAGAVAALAVAFPYWRHGTLGELIGLPRAISTVMPVVTANAHDVWWLLSDGALRWPLDQEPFLGPLSYRLVAVALVGGFALLALARALREPSLGAVFAAGAFTGFGFFMAMTQVHENHMYVVFPLLAVAAAVDRRVAAVRGAGGHLVRQHAAARLRSG